MKVTITTKQAVNCLPKKDKISVYMQGFKNYQELFWGANDIKVAFSNANKIKINTDIERMQGHGIEVVASDTNRRYEMLFVEHDEEKLLKLQKELNPCDDDF